MLIRDQRIAYGPQDPAWFTQEFDQPILNAISIALVTTIVSYVTSGLFTDLVLGFKKKNETRICNLHIALLIERSTPLAVFSNMLRTDWLSRRYYHGQIPSDTGIAREEERIKSRVLLRLIVLIAFAPMMNAAAVFLTGQKDTTLSFKDVGFGGMGFGVNRDLSSLRQTGPAKVCGRAEIDLKRFDSSLMEFSICKTAPKKVLHADSKNFLSVSIFQKVAVDLKLRVDTTEVWVGNTGMVSPINAVEGPSYFVRPVISPEAAIGLVEIGMQLVSRACESGTFSTTSTLNSGVNNSTASQADLKKGRQMVAEKVFDCSPKSNYTAELFGTIEDLVKYMTFVDADSAELTRFSSDFKLQPFSRMDLLVFIRRRRRRVSLAILSVVALVLLLFRLLSTFVLNNDTLLGIELIVRDYLGFNWWESLLCQNDSTLPYNLKFQNGNVAHFGLPRSGLPMVKKFNGGIVGLENTSECFK